MKTYILLLLLFSDSPNAFCQLRIEGMVTDSAKSGLAGVSIAIKGTTIITISNSSGAFSLPVSDSMLQTFGDSIVLVMNFVGYSTTEVQIDRDRYNQPFTLLLKQGSHSFDELVMVGYETVSKDKVRQYVSFPWPPPEFSASSNLDNKFFTKASILKQVDTILVKALSIPGYTDKAYYYIPNGFALVTRIEQIQEDGASHPPSSRWNIKTKPAKNLVLRSYLKSLFFPTPGYFRVIVFAVTDKPFASSGKQVKKETAVKWVKEGLNKLPDDIGVKKFRKDYSCTALIYEFKKPESDEAFLLNPCPLTAQNHLEKAGIISALNKN